MLIPWIPSVVLLPANTEFSHVVSLVCFCGVGFRCCQSCYVYHVGWRYCVYAICSFICVC